MALSNILLTSVPPLSKWQFVLFINEHQHSELDAWLETCMVGNYTLEDLNLQMFTGLTITTNKDALLFKLRWL